MRHRAKQALGLSSVTEALLGAVTVLQRTDSSLRVNVHASRACPCSPSTQSDPLWPQAVLPPTTASLTGRAAGASLRSMVDAVRKAPASYADVLSAPATVVAEVVGGELHTAPRPAAKHARSGAMLGGELHNPFQRGRGGPGGWIILYEPELHLREDILVPDWAGWKRERMPELPEVPFFELVPDWCCEILSPSTRSFDRVAKVPVYAREGARHLWLLDPDARTLEVLRLDGESYRLIATHSDDEVVRAEPFDAIELELALLWSR